MVTIALAHGHCLASKMLMDVRQMTHQVKANAARRKARVLRETDRPKPTDKPALEKRLAKSEDDQRKLAAESNDAILEVAQVAEDAGERADALSDQNESLTTEKAMYSTGLIVSGVGLLASLAGNTFGVLRAFARTRVSQLRETLLELEVLAKKHELAKDGVGLPEDMANIAG